MKNGRDAAAQFQSVIDHRGQAPTSPLYALAHLGLARAAVLDRNADKARGEYEQFFALWADADQTLPPLKEARQEYAGLR